MARRTNGTKGTKGTNENNRQFKKTTKDFPSQNYKMRGEIVKATTFGEDDQHAQFTIVDEVSERKYSFRLFNMSDAEFDLINESDCLEVYFNLQYNSYKDNISLQLVATEIHCADE